MGVSYGFLFPHRATDKTMNRTKMEFAKNPDAKVRVSCTQCKATYPFEVFLREVRMAAPYETVVEGILVCPDCGHRIHSYYMPENTRFLQSLLEKSIKKWSDSRSPADYQEYNKRQRSFQTSFDAAQRKFNAIFGTSKKEKVREPSQ